MAWLTAGMVVPPEEARLDDRPDDIGNEQRLNDMNARQ